MATASNGATRTALPGGAVALRTRNGELLVKPDGRVLFLALVGTCDLPLVEALVAAFESISATHTRPIVVSHALDHQAFTPEARQFLNAWTRKTPPNVHALILVRSRIVRMVLSVLAMLVPSQLELFSEESAFEVAVDRVLPAGVRNPHLKRQLAERVR